MKHYLKAVRNVEFGWRNSHQIIHQHHDHDGQKDSEVTYGGANLNTQNTLHTFSACISSNIYINRLRILLNTMELIIIRFSLWYWLILNPRYENLYRRIRGSGAFFRWKKVNSRQTKCKRCVCEGKQTLVGKYLLFLICLRKEERKKVVKKRMTDQKRTSGT